MDEGAEQAAEDSPRERRLLEELRRVARRVDPVPPEVAEAGRASLGWRRLDAELAELVADESELAGSGELVAVRGGPGDDTPRLLRFTAGDLSIELQVSRAGRGRLLLGQLVPPGPAAIELRHRGGVSAADADEHGRFALPDCPAGPVSLRVRLTGGPAGRVVETAWQLV